MGTSTSSTAKTCVSWQNCFLITKLSILMLIRSCSTSFVRLTSKVPMPWAISPKKKNLLMVIGFEFCFCHFFCTCTYYFAFLFSYYSLSTNKGQIWAYNYFYLSLNQSLNNFIYYCNSETPQPHFQ